MYLVNWFMERTTVLDRLVAGFMLLFACCALLVLLQGEPPHIVDCEREEGCYWNDVTFACVCHEVR